MLSFHHLSPSYFSYKETPHDHFHFQWIVVIRLDEGWSPTQWCTTWWPKLIRLISFYGTYESDVTLNCSRRRRTTSLFTFTVTSYLDQRPKLKSSFMPIFAVLNISYGNTVTQWNLVRVRWMWFAPVLVDFVLKRRICKIPKKWKY